ncbi:alpha-tocopherol transfer protein-like [Drosophila sulfurigaster albostrigata]|uniref:alpha-tocopherol transfer protein-like n=1 Tax=Drosophila sulfurigaster albostrigata TaxID=89887 RepID=UPI002D218D64|nr:alpha-tocopherol transfer protein-like [Drosophila sulfurigaster albostrigata]
MKMATPPKGQALEAVQTEVREWFEANPNLPEKIHPIVLRRFLKCMDYDVKKTKALIELNYNLRNKNTNIYIDRDLDDEKTAQALKASDLVLLPGVTPERHKLLFFRMVDYDPRSRNTEQEAKVFFMVSDTRFTEPDIPLDIDTNLDADEVQRMSDQADADIADGDIHIVDINGYTMRHLAYVSIFVLRVQMKFLQEAYPSRLKAVHIINCPSFLDRMMAMMKPFIREEILQLMHYHTEGLDSLYEKIPRDMLPNEYGGKAGSMTELKAQWIQNMKEKTPYLRDDKYWRITSATKSRWSWF